MNPLANKLRPKTLNEVIGQTHILGENKILPKMLKSGKIMNMIFYGPPGTGKTTVANIIADSTGKKFYKLNATTDSLKDIKQVISELNTMMGYNGILLYIDEIHHFNKRIQQSLLEFIETGQITLIGSTTENPYFYIFKAVLSRCIVLEFKPLTVEDIENGLEKAIKAINNDLEDKKVNVEQEVIKCIAESSDGDLRRALNVLEALAFYGNFNIITMESLKNFGSIKIMNYDRDGDSHYDILSAFQKSIRGSDPDASVFYLAMLIKSGDLISICRRLIVIAAEDIGLAYPQAISIVKACVDSAMQIGLPEARIPLAEATLLLATSPKSNSAINAIDSALNNLNSKYTGEIPINLRDGHYEGAKKLGRMQKYLYPHDYENNYVKQQYLPEQLKNQKFYFYGKNKIEQTSKKYWDNIKKK